MRAASIEEIIQQTKPTPLVTDHAALRATQKMPNLLLLQRVVKAENTFRQKLQ